MPLHHPDMFHHQEEVLEQAVAEEQVDGVISLVRLGVITQEVAVTEVEDMTAVIEADSMMQVETEEAVTEVAIATSVVGKFDE